MICQCQTSICLAPASRGLLGTILFDIDYIEVTCIDSELAELSCFRLHASVENTAESCILRAMSNEAAKVGSNSSLHICVYRDIVLPCKKVLERE